MSKFLLSVTENYRVDSEPEAKNLIEEAKKANVGSLTKFSSVYKTQKQKGEVVDSWYRVSLTKEFTKEKDPDTQVDVHYEG